VCLRTGSRWSGGPKHNGKSGTDINDTPIFGCVFGNLKLEGRTSVIVDNKCTLENTEGAIKTRQYRETDNIEYTRQRNTKQRWSGGPIFLPKFFFYDGFLLMWCYFKF
jgi:hypothetical protein